MMRPHHDSMHCAVCNQQEIVGFVDGCVQELVVKNDALTERYKLGTWGRWDFDLPIATLRFAAEEGAPPQVVCEIQVAGSIQGESWQWGWANQSLPETCRELMSSVREFGERRGLKFLTLPFLQNDEQLGWECSAMACHLLQAHGVYRCPTSNGGFVYAVILSVDFTH